MSFQKKSYIRIFIVAGFYLLLALASGYLFEYQHTYFTIRLAPGFGLIAALMFGWPAFAGIFIGELLYFCFISNPGINFPVTVALAANAVLYAYIGIKLLERYLKSPRHLMNSLDGFKFIIFGGLSASLIPSVLAVLCISLIEPAVKLSFLLMTAHWFFGQVLGVLIVAPFTFCFIGKSMPIWQTRIPLVPVLLTIMLAVTVTIYTYVTVQEEDNLEYTLEQKSLNMRSAITQQMSNYEEALYSIKSLFEYTPDIDPLEFEVFSTKIKMRQPGIHAISYQKLVKANERDAYETEMRKIYSDSFQITERDGSGKFKRAGDREEYTPVTMRSIYDMDAKILGFDTSSSNYSKLARQEARETNQVSISKAFKLASTTNDNRSVVLYLPLMNNGLFSGFVSLSVYINKTIHAALESVNMKGISLKVWDGPSAENNLIYFKKSVNPSDESLLNDSGRIRFLSHVWDYELATDSTYLNQLIKAQLLAVIFCILLSSIVLIRLLEFSGKRYELSRRASESEARFKGAFSNAAIGMAIVSLQHRIVDANPAFCLMLGYTKEELEGKYFADITYADDIELSVSYHNKLVNKIIDHYSFDKRYIHKDGFLIWANLSVSLTCDDEGVPLYGVVQIQDITKQKEHADELNHLATHDSLTGLVNRREFERRIKRLLVSTQKDKREHALCFMDLDQFKVVNDTCGHAAGDAMLHQLSTVLFDIVRHRDTLARLGGDEFGILMEHCGLDDAHRVAASLQKAVQDYQFIWEGRGFKVGVSIGLVPITSETGDLGELLKQADAACYMAKDNGRNRIHIYQAEDSETTQRHGEMQWATRVQQAVAEDRFCLFAQLIEPLNGSTDCHYEFLIRMLDSKDELIPPGAFLSAAERYNLAEKIDHWVIEKAFHTLASNPVFMEKINFCSINLSGQSLTSVGMLEFIMTQLQKTGVDGDKICFEVTETAAISNLSTAMKFISTLKGFGCRFALDDFGSGLSSFGYLKNLPVDYLKIDGMFVKDIVDDPIDHAMVKSINEIGHVMGMKTIAEFVENDVIKGMLKEIGVDYAQGFGIGKPQPLSKLLESNFESNNVTQINDVQH